MDYEVKGVSPKDRPKKENLDKGCGKDSWITKQSNDDTVDHVKWRNMDNTHKDRSK